MRGPADSRAARERASRPSHGNVVCADGGVRPEDREIVELRLGDQDSIEPREGRVEVVRHHEDALVHSEGAGALALAEATFVAERIRERIARVPFDLGGPRVSITVSAGRASLTCCLGATTEELMGIADRRLYRAKATGRNRVVSVDDG